MGLDVTELEDEEISDSGDVSDSTDR